eukprot:1159965-Pelagomonas_calceolata.AAC.2
MPDIAPARLPTGSVAHTDSTCSEATTTHLSTSMTAKAPSRNCCSFARMLSVIVPDAWLPSALASPPLSSGIVCA